MNNNIAKVLMGYWPISDRIVMIKLQGKQFNLKIIQLYAPTQDYNDDDIEAFYEEVQTAIKQVKSNEILCVMGDMNAKVGSSAIGSIVGKVGLRERNERGERLIQSCEENKLTICNTWFQHHVRKRYTWKSPGDITRNQIDYIMVNERFKNSIKQAKAMPRADINSDHIPVKIKMNLKLKNLRKVKVKEQLELELLKQPEYRDKYNIEIRNRYYVLGNDPSGEQVDEETAEIVGQSLNTLYQKLAK